MDSSIKIKPNPIAKLSLTAMEHFFLSLSLFGLLLKTPDQCFKLGAIKFKHFTFLATFNASFFIFKMSPKLNFSNDGLDKYKIMIITKDIWENWAFPKIPIDNIEATKYFCDPRFFCLHVTIG